MDYVLRADGGVPPDQARDGIARLQIIVGPGRICNGPRSGLAVALSEGVLEGPPSPWLGACTGLSGAASGP
eukprot:2026702-Alexandrium_andersonii.AAC.1